MLDKLKLNNLVITNKKLILKARVQTIAKLVQKLRKAKTKTESVKDKDKTRKYMECISELKTQKPVELMRQVLAQSGGNTKSVLTNGRSTPKELSLAMLEENKIMSQLLDKFREELKLDTDKGKVEWREEILEMSKRRAKLERTEEKKRKRKELKELKANDRKRTEWLKVNQQHTEGDEVPDSKVELVDNTPQQQSIKTRNSSKNPEEPRKLKEKPITKTPKPGTQSNEPTKQKPIKLKEELKTKPKKSDNQANKSINQAPAKLKEKALKKPTKERPTHVIDPFFITESGQPYLSTAIDNSDDDEDEKQPIRQVEFPPPATNNWRKQKYENTFEKPSANQKEGKKIKFNDDGEASFVSPAPAPASAPTVSTEGMHPSWIAKQKLKPKIAQFQGTKITFDD